MDEEVILVPAVIAGIMALCAILGALMPSIKESLRQESDEDQPQ